jgi:hypothetical protein
MIDMLTSISGLALLGIVALALVLRRRDIALAGGLLALVYGITLYAAHLDPTHVRNRGLAEGCFGDPTLSYAALGLIGLAAFLRAAMPRKTK